MKGSTAMPSNPVKSAPVATMSTLEAVLGAVLTLLVAHHVIPATLAETYGPLAVVALVALFGAIKWRNVTPVVKVEALAGKLAGEVADAMKDPAVQSVEAQVIQAAQSAQAGAPEPPAAAPQDAPQPPAEQPAPVQPAAPSADAGAPQA